MLSGADLMRVMFADYLSYSRTYQIAENARTVVRQIQVPAISLLQRKVIGAKASCNSRLFGIVDTNQTEQSLDVLINSDVDWGQDVYFLKEWLKYHQDQHRGQETAEPAIWRVELQGKELIGDWQV